MGTCTQETDEEIHVFGNHLAGQRSELPCPMHDESEMSKWAGKIQALKFHIKKASPKDITREEVDDLVRDQMLLEKMIIPDTIGFIALETIEEKIRGCTRNQAMTDWCQCKKERTEAGLPLALSLEERKELSSAKSKAGKKLTKIEKRVLGEEVRDAYEILKAYRLQVRKAGFQMSGETFSIGRLEKYFMRINMATYFMAGYLLEETLIGF